MAANTGVAFGASRCILVRIGAFEKRLPPSLVNALVLTVEQFEGLQFDDCILVNFFSDSLYRDWDTIQTFWNDFEGGKRRRRSRRGRGPRSRPSLRDFPAPAPVLRVEASFAAMILTRSCVPAQRNFLEKGPAAGRKFTEW